MSPQSAVIPLKPNFYTKQHISGDTPQVSYQNSCFTEKKYIAECLTCCKPLNFCQTSIELEIAEIVICNLIKNVLEVVHIKWYSVMSKKADNFQRNI